MWRQKWETGEYQRTGAYEDGANDENDDDHDDDDVDDDDADDDDDDDTKGITLDNKYDSEVVYHHNNIAGKITECWLVNEESIFFLILLREEGKITRSRLVLKSPSNSSFNREVVFLQQWRLVSR